MHYFNHNQSFALEAGGVLPQFNLAYHTYGSLNESRNNVVWICHALTANSDAQDWWPGLIGPRLLFDTDKYFVVCVNMLGSCYGSTGPLSVDAETNEPYYHTFPAITIRDMVNAQYLLCRSLGIQKIHLMAGGSMGGYQALEWCVMYPALVHQLFLITTSVRESAWGIAIHTAQRLAIEADVSWTTDSPQAAAKGLKVARAIGMITYRNYALYAATQTDPDINKLDGYKASSYINYQGDKLVNRFNAFSYWTLSKAMDSHNLARGRGTIENVLQAITQKTLVIGITSDFLCPLAEQRFIAQHMPNATFTEIDSAYGHDGFLIEAQKITAVVNGWIDP